MRGALSPLIVALTESSPTPSSVRQELTLGIFAVVAYPTISCLNEDWASTKVLHSYTPISNH